jgi:hypothetical protein
VPETVVAFSHWSEPCDALGAGFLLRNLSDGPLEIVAAAASPPTLTATLDESGRTVLPGETVHAVLTYARTQSVGAQVEGTLTVVTDAGCVELEVLGQATDEALTSISEGAIDFGTLRPSEVSPVREVSVVYQRSPAFDFPTEFAGFAASPPDVFQLVESPETAFEPSSCESFRLMVQFNAPEARGPVDGALTWLQTTDTPQGAAEGVVFIPLFGRVE